MGFRSDGNWPASGSQCSDLSSGCAPVHAACQLVSFKHGMRHADGETKVLDLTKVLPGSPCPASAVNQHPCRNPCPIPPLSLQLCVWAARKVMAWDHEFLHTDRDPTTLEFHLNLSGKHIPAWLARMPVRAPSAVETSQHAMQRTSNMLLERADGPQKGLDLMTALLLLPFASMLAPHDHAGPLALALHYLCACVQPAASPENGTWMQMGTRRAWT